MVLRPPASMFDRARAPWFTAPTMDTFLMLMGGWGLDLRRHTFIEVERATKGSAGRSRR